MPASAHPALPVRMTGIWTTFGSKVIHQDLSLEVRPGEVVALVGGSGSGKTTLLRHMMGLTEPAKGTVEVFGEHIRSSYFLRQRRLRERWGVLFQFGALYSALTVLENIMVPLHERGNLSRAEMMDIAYLKLAQSGLKPSDADKLPSELSGGMIKRAALARALALDPDIVFLDEPTSGLDPISAAEFDELVVKLRDTMDLTVYMVTHDLDTLFTACDRVAVLGKKKVLVEGTIDDMLKSDEPWVKSYFRGKRARQLDLAARA
jgi:phospholipid/cholesterol/gamma-HCH transport system ATP-binding protein